jgi:inner membrane protein
MPTIVTHGFVATLLGRSLAAGRMPARSWFLSVLCSILPDTDVLGFPLGISYEDVLGHRGLSHSLVFAFVLSSIVSFIALPQVSQRRTRLLLVSYFFVVTASHGILDAMTDGGLGVAFFAPFDDTPYRTLILQRPRTRCNLERVPVGVHSRHHHRRRGLQPPQAPTASRQSRR